MLIMNDTTAKKNHELYLKEKAYRDSLTGLWNRYGFKKAFLPIREKAEQTAVFMIDIDWFKTVNDKFGHLNGDKVLQHLTKILEEELGEYNIIGRFDTRERHNHITAARYFKNNYDTLIGIYWLDRKSTRLNSSHH